MEKEKEPCINTALRHKMYVGLSGGDDGNRTRVRKPIHTTFYGCSLFLTFPRVIVNKHTITLGSLQYTARTQALSCGVHHLVDALTEAVVLNSKTSSN